MCGCGSATASTTPDSERVALTTLWCLAIQLIPVAPPRLVPALHIEDTPALFGQTVYPSFGKSGPAQLSAMPSVHVAWAVIIGVGIVIASSTRRRWFALAHPVVTMIVVVVTGNHFWADGIVGIAAARCSRLCSSARCGGSSPGNWSLAGHAQLRVQLPCDRGRVVEPESGTTVTRAQAKKSSTDVPGGSGKSPFSVKLRTITRHEGR